MLTQSRPPTPSPQPPLGALVVKSNATVPFRALFCCRPAGRLHLSPLLFMSPLTTCSPHSSTFSQKPQFLLLSLLHYLLIFLHLLLSSFLFSYDYYASSSNSSPFLPHFCTSLLLQLIHSFSLLWILHLRIIHSVSAFDFFDFKSVQVVLKHSSECSLSHLAPVTSPPPSASLFLFSLFAFRSCRLEDSVHLLPDTA